MPYLRIFLVSLVCLLGGSQPLQADSRLLTQVQHNLALGHFYSAAQQLKQLEIEATGVEDDYTMTLAQGLRGYLALQQQDMTTAETLLTTALTQAQQRNWTELMARLEIYLGDFYQQNQNFSQAQHYFALARTESEKLTDKSLLVSSLINQAKLMTGTVQTDTAWQQLQQAKNLLENIPPSKNTSPLWLSLGYQTVQFYLKTQKTDVLAFAFAALQQALSQAKQFQQADFAAESLKYLALLYKQQQRNPEAVKLLLEGIKFARQSQTQDLLLDLHWELGQLYKAEQQPAVAITAYRAALNHLENIRLDIPVSYQKGLSSFKKTFAPLYLGLADLLLQQARSADAKQQQSLLKEAQNTVELMKKSELEDYFQSRCEIPATALNLQEVDVHAAAVHPVPLPDRLELIAYTASGLHQFTQPVRAEELEKTARDFAAKLRSYQDFDKTKSQAQLLYQWLISPLKPLLTQQAIQTLIYIPDGALRLVPLAGLYDGQKFLIEDYAVVNSIGMSLIDSSTLAHKNPQMLLAGMSVPGEVVTHLPESILAQLLKTGTLASTGDKRQLTRDLKLRGGEEEELTEDKKRELLELLKNQQFVHNLKLGLSLPGVEKEIKALASQHPAESLLNEDFSLANFSQTASSQGHKILHIATHGFFGATVEESFIMTHDRILSMNQLENLLSSAYLKANPIDLMTLSACQTAEGDDRSPLGISGIAIKARVHSALGSLWSVADEATSQLMATFYQGLNHDKLTKAKALQRAEIQLLRQQKFSNPSFWSPFILVGNWL